MRSIEINIIHFHIHQWTCWNQGWHCTIRCNIHNIAWLHVISDSWGSLSMDGQWLKIIKKIRFWLFTDIPGLIGDTISSNYSLCYHDYFKLYMVYGNTAFIPYKTRLAPNSMHRHWVINCFETEGCVRAHLIVSSWITWPFRCACPDWSEDVHYAIWYMKKGQ